ncbi:uncharacterized protein LOC118188179 [Stegodyphus dumicola]|uniref:uncharacterized protein LOC118188179 n=1 Tax=Stegodyphus dumicola TaxID=202533 RepID=UPI0015B1CBEB|nr:uncharacterized protein LOC118188179 [Stegodyphus dumicola]
MSILDSDETFEDILGRSYDAEFSEEDKVYISAVLNRLRRILHWDPEDEESLFNKNRGPQIMIEIMSYFTRWKSLVCQGSNLTDILGLQHLITYSLAKLCFLYWIEDSNIVAEVLRQVYSCDGHFSFMFLHIVNRCERRPPWRTSAEDSRQKEHLAMLYFLYHAHKAKCEYHGTRFVNLRLRTPLRVPPVFLAAIYNKPRLLLLLLRYGANLYTREDGISDDWDLFMLLRHLTRVLWTSLGYDFQNHETDSTMISFPMHNVILCLRVLLRSIRQIKMSELDFPLMNFDQGSLTGSTSSRNFVNWISEEGLVSKLVSRYLDPAELKHLCRFEIRRVLNRNWKLPYGIVALPIPKLLQDYINLSDD